MSNTVHFHFNIKIKSNIQNYVTSRAGRWVKNARNQKDSDARTERGSNDEWQALHSGALA